MKISILNPIGYCAGVKNAIYIAEKARSENPNKEIYVLGKLIHNDYIIEYLNNLQINTIFEKNVDSIDLIKKIPNGSVVIFTAHGHEKQLDYIAQEKNLIVYDAVCQMVKKNMDDIYHNLKKDHDVIYIGIKDHPETNSCLSLSKKVHFYDINADFDFVKINDKAPFIVNQTTVNYVKINKIQTKIKKHFPNAIFSNVICNVSKERQENITHLEKDVDVIFVIGDKASSNTNRLVEVSLSYNKNATSYLISSKDDIKEDMLKNKKHLVISSGASTPDIIIQSVINKINNLVK